MKSIVREIILDTETTGLNPEDGHKIVEIGCIELIDKVQTGRYFHKYINPCREVPEEAYRIHGISSEFLRDMPKFDEIVNDFLEFIGDSTLVIHNAGFDVKFLNYELRQVGLGKIDSGRGIVDTLTLARSKFPGSPVNLDALCKRFKIDLSKREKHGALLDSELLADVYINLSGGYQNTLTMNVKAKKRIEVKFEKRILIKRDNPSLVLDEEKELHNNFLSKVKDPIWSKVFDNN